LEKWGIKLRNINVFSSNFKSPQTTLLSKLFRSFVSRESSSKEDCVGTKIKGREIAKKKRKTIRPLSFGKWKK
jgi:hypothetical protein